METKDLANKNQSTNIYIVPHKNRKKGVIYIAVPILGLSLVFITFDVVNYFLKRSNLDATTYEGLQSITSVILGFIGLIFVVATIVGLILGIKLLNKKELADSKLFDPRSGEGKKSEIPPEIKGWNWGAAGLSAIWGLYHRVWIYLLIVIPIFNVFWIIVLGRKGNEWAWRKNKWESVEQFKSSQKKWMVWGIVFFIITLLSVSFNLFSFPGQTDDFYNSQPTEIQNKLDDIQENFDPNDITSDENINKFIELMELQGGKILDKDLFREAVKAGVNDGQLLNDFDERFFLKDEFALGYSMGYPMGCMLTKNDESFCRNLIERKSGAPVE